MKAVYEAERAEEEAQALAAEAAQSAMDIEAAEVAHFEVGDDAPSYVVPLGANVGTQGGEPINPESTIAVVVIDCVAIPVQASPAAVTRLQPEVRVDEPGDLVELEEPAVVDLTNDAYGITTFHEVQGQEPRDCLRTVVECGYWRLHLYFFVIAETGTPGTPETIVILPRLEPHYQEPEPLDENSTPLERASWEDRRDAVVEARRDAWRGYFRHPRVRHLMTLVGIEPAAVSDIDISPEDALRGDFAEIAQVARHGYIEVGDTMEEEARSGAESPEEEQEAIDECRRLRRERAIELTMVQHFAFHRFSEGPRAEASDDAVSLAQAAAILGSRFID